MYALRGGFLVRPLLISLALGLTGMILSEESFPVISAWVPHALFPSRADPQIAQIMLGAIASSIMTVVSIVFAILLVTLTLASMQFSPRILVSFVRDRVTQWTLGVFLGTFLYCMAALPAARSLPQPFAPVATVTGALVLALTSVIGLIFFIHHISRAVNVNHIVDRIARETEDVIDETMPHKRGFGLRQEDMTFAPDDTEFPVLNEQSGYICFVDTARLLKLAKAYGLRIRVLRPIGHFVPQGVPFFTVSRRSRLTTERTRYRANAHTATRCRIWRAADCRYRIESHLARGERSQHGDQLRRSTYTDPDPMGRARATSESSERSAACCSSDHGLDRLRSSA
jgi:uncharacterized membrane protein